MLTAGFPLSLVAYAQNFLAFNHFEKAPHDRFGDLRTDPESANAIPLSGSGFQYPARRMESGARS
jgi:hypothetical protein